MKFLIVVFYLISHSLFADVVIRDIPLPDDKLDCVTCTFIHFQHIQFTVPIKTVFIASLKSSTPNLIISSKKNSKDSAIFINDMTEFHQKGYEKYYKELKIKTFTEFFSLIGNVGNKSIMNFREAFGIKDAKSYYRYRKKSFTIFLINNKSNKNNTIWVVYDKLNELYMIEGDINEKFTNLLLTTLTVPD